MTCTGCGADGPTRLTPHGRWCPACMPPQPVPDPARTLDGLRVAAGIPLDTYPWHPALRRPQEPPAPLSATDTASLGPAARRVVERGERITRAQWLLRQRRAEEAARAAWAAE